MKPINKIIFIDDDELTLNYNKSLAEHFANAKEIRPFADPNEALEEIQSWENNDEHALNLFFVDVDMPEMSGHDFINQLKQTSYFENNLCQIIYLSSHDTLSNLIEAMDRKIEFFLKKPLSKDKLEDVLSAFNI